MILPSTSEGSRRLYRGEDAQDTFASFIVPRQSLHPRQFTRPRASRCHLPVDRTL